MHASVKPDRGSQLNQFKSQSQLEFDCSSMPITGEEGTSVVTQQDISLTVPQIPCCELTLKKKKYKTATHWAVVPCFPESVGSCGFRGRQSSRGKTNLKYG